MTASMKKWLWTVRSVAVLGACLVFIGGCPGTGGNDNTGGEPKPVIVTVAGTGVAGQNGDGQDPQETDLYLPQDITMSPDGELYIVDWNNHRIRRIADGVVETVAGTGELGDAQPGDALYTQFNHPTNVSFDSQGRMLIAAWHNSKVMRLDLTTGLVENLAGTGGRSFNGDGLDATATALDLPSSVFEAAGGEIYFSDQANFRVRYIDPADQTVHTVCGTGEAGYNGDEILASKAQLNSPKGQSAPPAGRIVPGANGEIVIADTGNHRIRIIGADGYIRTLAGTGEAGYTGDGGPAADAQLNTPSDVAVGPDGSIYVADTFNNVVRKIDAATGIITTIAGTGDLGYSGDGGPAEEAQLNRPYGVYVDADGTVYIADTHNQRVRKIIQDCEGEECDPVDVEPEPVEIIPCTDEPGSICTYAGTGGTGFNGDGLDRLQTILYWPWDVEFFSNGRIIFLDWNNHKVREILADDTVTTIAGTDFVGDGPKDLSDLITESVSSSDPNAGADPLTVDLNHPTDILEMPNGDILVVAWHNHKLREIDGETGKVLVTMGRGAGFNGDGLIANDTLANQLVHAVLAPNGDLFFVDQRNQRVRVAINYAEEREQALVTTIVGFSDAETGVAQKGYNGDGLPGLETSLSMPTGGNPQPGGGIAQDESGSLYYCDSENHLIRKVEFLDDTYTNTIVTTIAGTATVAGYAGDGGAATAAQINFPHDLEFGPDGNLYFADQNNNRVRKIDMTTGVITTVAGTGAEGYSGDGGPASEAELFRPAGVAFDAAGDLYISDSFNSRVRKVKMQY